VDIKTNEITSYGGFLSNIDNKKSYIRKSNSNVGVIKLKNSNIINTINYMSSIKYIINNKVLTFILKLLENSDDRILKLIILKPHPKTKDIYKLNLSHKHAELNEIFKYNSQYYCYKSVLQTAILFSK
jgi:hypothetical protein